MHTVDANHPSTLYPFAPPTPLPLFPSRLRRFALFPFSAPFPPATADSRTPLVNNPTRKVNASSSACCETSRLLHRLQVVPKRAPPPTAASTSDGTVNFTTPDAFLRRFERGRVCLAVLDGLALSTMFNFHYLTFGLGALRPRGICRILSFIISWTAIRQV